MNPEKRIKNSDPFQDYLSIVPQSSFRKIIPLPNRTIFVELCKGHSGKCFNARAGAVVHKARRK
jgi:ribonuclease HI